MLTPTRQNTDSDIKSMGQTVTKRKLNNNAVPTKNVDIGTLKQNVSGKRAADPTLPCSVPKKAEEADIRREKLNG